MAALRPLFLALIVLPVTACTAGDDTDNGPTTDDSNEVKVDTRSPEARRQYDANVAFATSYTPRCARSGDDRPRVLVTGFGRFMSIADNATGRIVSALVPTARYPETQPPAPGQVDEPGPQLSVGTTTLDLPGIGSVDVCGMVLPVYWDLAAILIAKEMEAFEPSFVMMNGVASGRQPIWIELGATNRAAQLEDGSSQLVPAVQPGQPHAKIIETAARSEDAQPNLLSWRAVEAAAREVISERAGQLEGDVRFDQLLPDVKLAGYPRGSNTYLCNNVTYVTGWLMNHPGREIALLRASPRLPGKINEVRVRLEHDYRAVPRVFVHWPSEMADKHHASGAAVMQAIIAGQLGAVRRGDPPSKGDNAIADPTLRGGDTF